VSQVTIKACTPMFIAALFTIAKLWKQPRCPTTDKWIKKMWNLYIMQFYSATKKNEILLFAGKLMGVLLNMWIVDLKQMQQYYEAWVTLKGGCAREGEGKGRKPNS
jgi:hypothetical protein